jgi:protein-disulfide isomerase
MHRRVQLAANAALVVVAIIYLVQTLWPGALARVGGRLIPSLTVLPPTTPPVQAAKIAIPAEPLSIGGTPQRGSAETPVVLIEYSDYECPYCAAFEAGSLQAIKREYLETGKVALVNRHLPLAALHPLATRAAVAAVCAAAQGRFWELHDVLIANRQALDEAALETETIPGPVEDCELQVEQDTASDCPGLCDICGRSYDGDFETENNVCELGEDLKSRSGWIQCNCGQPI